MTNAKLNRLRHDLEAARESYHATHSDAARKRMKRAMANWLKAGGVLRMAVR